MPAGIEHDGASRHDMTEMMRSAFWVDVFTVDHLVDVTFHRRQVSIDLHLRSQPVTFSIFLGTQSKSLGLLFIPSRRDEMQRRFEFAILLLGIGRGHGESFRCQLVASKCMASRFQKAPADFQPSRAKASMTSMGMVARTGQGA